MSLGRRHPLLDILQDGHRILKIGIVAGEDGKIGELSGGMSQGLAAELSASPHRAEEADEPAGMIFPQGGKDRAKA